MLVLMRSDWVIRNECRNELGGLSFQLDAGTRPNDKIYLDMFTSVLDGSDFIETVFII